MSSFQNKKNDGDDDDDDDDDDMVQVIVGVMPSSSTKNKCSHSTIKNPYATAVSRNRNIRNFPQSNDFNGTKRKRVVENPYLVYNQKKAESYNNDKRINARNGQVHVTSERTTITTDQNGNSEIGRSILPSSISSTTTCKGTTKVYAVKNPYASSSSSSSTSNKVHVDTCCQEYPITTTVNKKFSSNKIAMDNRTQNTSEIIGGIEIKNDHCNRRGVSRNPAGIEVANPSMKASSQTYITPNGPTVPNHSKLYTTSSKNSTTLNSTTQHTMKVDEVKCISSDGLSKLLNNVTNRTNPYSDIKTSTIENKAKNKLQSQLHDVKPISPNFNSTTQKYIPQQYSEVSNQSITKTTTMSSLSNKSTKSPSATNNISSKPITKIKPSSKLPPLPDQLRYDENRLKPVNDEYRLQLIRNANKYAQFKNGWQLYPHQKAGVLKGLLMRRLVLAFDMGLGKTLVACTWAKAFVETFDNMMVYIVAPVSLKESWKQTVIDTVDLKCKDELTREKKKNDNAATKRRKTKDESKEAKSSSSSSSKIPYDVEIFSWAKVPPIAIRSVERYVVICDEAHNLQSMESARTKDTLSLVSDERCKGVLLLTGTPMKNGKPSNLFPLLRATRHPFGDDQRVYETFFCNGQQRQYGQRLVWDASGNSNLNILNAHISSHVFHKTKEECLKGLPTKTRMYKQVPVSSRFELQHNKAIREMYNVQLSLDSLEKDSGNEAILGAFSRVRLIASLAKIDATVALAKSILVEESSLVIFTHFVEVAKQVRRKLDESGWQGELLVGETPAKHRQSMVDRFQDGITPVFVATFGAGGVGITLTKASTIILLDRPWTPGDALQAEDRVRRIGQNRPVKSIWLRAFQIDTQIDELIEEKTMNSSAVISGQTTGLTNQSKKAPKISIRKLVESILAKTDINKLSTS